MSSYDQSTPPEAEGIESVGSVPKTPIEARVHAATKMFAPGEAGYIVRNNEEHVIIQRLRTPQPTDTAQPSTSNYVPPGQVSGQAERSQDTLRTKIRPKDNRARISPTNQAYPTARVSKAKNALRDNSERENPETSDPALPRTTFHRGAKGRFQKKPSNK